ncbi:YdbL family protein [Azospirillum sp.]|uniref:YdbL family protein n=1 Tax=Azospirillum sp. TaxID=34012 RepID=UPI003D75BBA5
MNRWFSLLALTLGLALSAPAFAQDPLSGAKQAGQLGERPDGLVGVVPGAPAAAQAVAEQVNAQRLQRYRDIAASNGTSVDKVQAVAGQQLIDRTPAGQYVLSGGKWVKK